MATASNLIRNRGTNDSGADNDYVNIGSLRGLHIASLTHISASNQQSFTYWN